MPTRCKVWSPETERLVESFVAPPAALPLVSVVCAVHNQLDYTKQFAASLEQNADCAYELILVDNGSSDGTTEWAKSQSIKVQRWNANQGVPAAYNEGVRLATGGLLCFANNDMVCHPGGLRRLAEASYARGMAAQSANSYNALGDYLGCTADHKWSDAPEGYVLVFQREVWDKTGVWDTAFFPSYCLTPETPVLKSDLTWSPVGNLKVGDELVGVDEHTPSSQGRLGSRSYISSHVTTTSRRSADCLKITLDDGRSVICSEDHKWLSKCPEPNNTPYMWRQAAKMNPGYRICAPLDVWEPDTSYDGGWLGGIFDGEGYLNISEGQVRKFGIGFCQKAGLVLDKALGVLTQHKIPFLRYVRDSDSLARIEINCRRDVLRTLGTFRPVRLMDHVKDAWQGRRMRSRNYRNDVAIAAIERVGVQEVVTLETSSHTYIANGMVSHNCDDADWGLRARLAGYDYTLVPGAVTHFGQKTSGGMNLDETVRAHGEILRARYVPHGLGQRILVIRYAAAGDILMTTPILRALKKQAPLSRLHFYAHAGAGGVLAGNSHVDHRCDGSIDPKRYHRIIDLTGAYEEPQRSGTWDHPVRAYARRAEVEFDGGRYDFQIPAKVRDWAAAMLPKTPNTQIACGVRSGTRIKANMRASNWLAIADALPAGYFLVALDSEARPKLGRAACPDDARFYDHPKVMDLTGRTQTMHHAGALIERCDAFVGVDSGLLHVAHGLGKPIHLMIAGPPLLARLPIVGPVSGHEGDAACFPCQYRTKCPEDSHCLDYVQGSEVVRKLLGMIA